MDKLNIEELLGKTKVGKLKKINNPKSQAHKQVVETNPTEKQIEAENYTKAHVRLDGLAISIENPDGTTRSGIDSDGNKWTSKIFGDYGYFKNTMGYDGDHVDVFIKANYKGGSPVVYIVNQLDRRTKKFDEHKCILGATTEEEARTLYLKNYDEKQKDFISSIVPMSLIDFKKWVYSKQPKKGALKPPYGWIGVDLDGTLAKSTETYCADEIGAPVPRMVQRVNEWLAAGRDVRIMTARAHNMDAHKKKIIEQWCKKHIGRVLPITNKKDPEMTELWDDRAVAVAKNRGYSKKAVTQTYITSSLGREYPCNTETVVGVTHYKVQREDGHIITEVKVADFTKGRGVWLYYWHTDPAYRGTKLGTRLLDYVLSIHEDIPVFLGVGSFDKLGENGEYRERNNKIEDDILKSIYRRRGFISVSDSGYATGDIPYKDASMVKPPKGVKEASTVKVGANALAKFAAALPLIQKAEIPVTGPQAIRHALSTVDLDALIEASKTEVRTGPKSARSKAIAAMNVAEGLQRSQIKPEELMIKHVPVIPPVYRPFAVQGDTFIAGDANELYQDLFKMINARKAEELAFGKAHADTELNYRNAVRALYGFTDPVEPKTKQRGVTGFMRKLSGKGGSKFSYTQRKLLSKPMDSSARSTIIPDPDLGMDEIGLPEDMAWGIYSPYIQKRLVHRGYSLADSIIATDERSDDAKIALREELKVRPVVYSRPPAWHKFNVIAAKPRLTKNKAISVSTYITDGMNADFDGDFQIGSVYLRFSEEVLKNNKKVLQWAESMLYNSRMKTKNTQILTSGSGRAWLTDLANFPHGQLIHEKEGTNGVIRLYAVPVGIQVLTHDATTNTPVWADVAFWSEHPQRKLEIVTLKNRKQIFTDNDPRAIYGIATKGDARLSRFTPTQAVESAVVVPVIRKLPPVVSVEFLEVGDKVISINEHLGYTLGALCGDGWWSHTEKKNKYVHIADAKGYVSTMVLSCLRKWYTKADKNSVHLTKDKDPTRYGDTVRHTYHNVGQPFINKLSEWLGGEKSENSAGAQTKHLPHFYLADNTEFRKALLCGLFDTDGTICLTHGLKDRPRLAVSYCSISLRLVREVATLLRSFDIHAEVSKAKTSSAGNVLWACVASVTDVKKHVDVFDYIQDPDKIHVLQTAQVNDKFSSMQHDRIPVWQALYELVIPYLQNQKLSKLEREVGGPEVERKKARASLRTIWLKTTRDGTITRKSGLRIVEELKQDIMHRVDLLETIKAWASAEGPLSVNASVYDILMRGSLHVADKECKSALRRAFARFKKAGNAGTKALRTIRPLLDKAAIDTSLLDNEDFKTFERLIEDKSVSWSAVESVEKTDVLVDGYDLTVPGYETFASSDGVVLSNTMAVHAPSLPASVKEAYEKLMPSKMLFSIENPERVMPKPKHEQILGLYRAQTAPAKDKHVFATEEDALKAIKENKIRLSDEVVIGKN